MRTLGAGMGRVHLLGGGCGLVVACNVWQHFRLGGLVTVVYRDAAASGRVYHPRVCCLSQDGEAFCGATSPVGAVSVVECTCGDRRHFSWDLGVVLGPGNMHLCRKQACLWICLTGM